MCGKYPFPSEWQHEKVCLTVLLKTPIALRRRRRARPQDSPGTGHAAAAALGLHSPVSITPDQPSRHKARGGDIVSLVVGGIEGLWRKDGQEGWGRGGQSVGHLKCWSVSLCRHIQFLPLLSYVVGQCGLPGVLLLMF